jgi:hypothetical protein
MPLGSLKSVNNLALKQLEITASITYANMQALGTTNAWGQLTIENVAGNYKTYNVFDNGVQIATDISTSSYTITGLGNNERHGPYTLVPYYGNNIPGNTYTIIYRNILSAGGVLTTTTMTAQKIYTLAKPTGVSTSNTGCYRTTLNISGTLNTDFVSYWVYWSLTWGAGSAYPATGYNSTASAITYTLMTSASTYQFDVQAVNGDGIWALPVTASAVLGYISVSSSGVNTFTTGNFGAYRYLEIGASAPTYTVTFFQQDITCDFCAVGGGGAGGVNTSVNGAGGGGAGGVLTGFLRFPAGYAFTMTVGTGGAASTNNRGPNGNDTTVNQSGNLSITVKGGTGGGGYGGGGTFTQANPNPGGGCGGGGGYSNTPGTSGVATLPTISNNGGFLTGYTSYGRNGGSGATTGGGGGGGAGAAGANASGNNGGAGGSGINWNVGGVLVKAVGGGGGGAGKNTGTDGAGGAGGGGAGGTGGNGLNITGGGGGGVYSGGTGNPSGAGGGGRIFLYYL